jgi:prevent-host-death family protein
MTILSISNARPRLGELVRSTRGGRRIFLTDHDAPAAVLISPEDLEDLEDSLALARLERDRALQGRAQAIPHEGARHMLFKAAGGAAS